MRENLTIGFIGNPNCGKTTLFNAYTGANLKVANWPGVTVEKVEGAIKDHDLNIRLVDLPGTYSLTSYTMEEQVSRQFILSDEVDVIIDVADASALAIFTPAGIILHTGDFKIDYTPVFGEPADLQRFAEIGKKGVLALMSDSTNAERPGFTQSERTVGITFDHIFAEHKDTRIIIATFASNVDRVQQIINTACKYDRKVVVEGRSMVNIIQVAQELGYLNVPDKTLIEIDQLKNYPPEKTVLITTGSQGESMAALSRMAADVHKKVTIMPGDTIIFSSNPIPGNEKSVSKVINELTAKGANVIFQDAHVSGHACQEELKLIYSLVKPKYAIPVHGEYRHLKANAGIAKMLGIPKENIFILKSGNVLELSDKEAKVVDNVHTGEILVDGLGVGDVGNIVLRDRQHLAEDGIMIVVLTLETVSYTHLTLPTTSRV